MQLIRLGLLVALCLVLSVGGRHGVCLAFQQGSSNAANRQDALRSLPLEKLDDTARSKVLSVVQESSFFRRLPVCVIRCDPELYLFVVRHPDVIVAIWRAMGVTEIELEESGPGKFRYKDADGTRGTVEYVYATHDTHVIYSEAVYEGPLFNRTVRSKAVILLKSGYVLETDGHYYVTSRLDAFVSVDKAAWEALTKTLHPLVGRIADANFTQTVQFVALLQETATQNPDGMQRLAGRLQNIQPQVRAEFAALLSKVAERHATLEQSRDRTVAERPNVNTRK